ncbi:RING-H2 finger protein ATL64-like [Primulina eburnea]|uniref:RING-H2 finger protein ATL64-like n=1 Tax=Primulina eburnea TaxID=1245227 RepID=UPI003C6C8ED6
MADSDHNVRIETEPSDGFLLSEKLMLAVVGILSAALVFVIGRHVYDRWYFMRLRRRERELHRRRPGPRIHSVLFGTNVPHHHIVDRGLEMVVLSSLPVFLYPRGEVQEEEPPQGCTVCLSEFEKDDIIRLLPKCNHSFHVDCIDMWFYSHSTCPLCRSRVERVAKPVQSRGRPGSSSGHGGESVSCEEGGNGDTAAADVETVSPPPDRFEYYLEDEDLAPCSGASQGVRFSRNRLMTLKRILSISRKPTDGGAAVDVGGGATCVDLERGELTRESNHAHTPNG